MELSSKLVSALFPEFHRVASLMVYTLHPTTFYQSGVSRNNVLESTLTEAFNLLKCVFCFASPAKIRGAKLA